MSASKNKLLSAAIRQQMSKKFQSEEGSLLSHDNQTTFWMHREREMRESNEQSLSTIRLIQYILFILTISGLMVRHYLVEDDKMRTLVLFYCFLGGLLMALFKCLENQDTIKETDKVNYNKIL